MKRFKRSRLAVIEATNGQQFENLINDKMDELTPNHPELKIEHGRFYRAYITYTIETEIPETIAERFTLCGLHFTCKDCPQYEPTKNADGTTDRRTKYGYCNYRDNRTYKDMAACERFHVELLKAGRTPDGETLPQALLLPANE